MLYNCIPTLNIPEDSWLDGIDPVATGAYHRRLRQHHNLTQEELSEALEKIGVSCTAVSISIWENGWRVPPLEVLQGLATLYRCTVSDLLITYRMSGGSDAA